MKTCLLTWALLVITALMVYCLEIKAMKEYQKEVEPVAAHIKTSLSTDFAWTFSNEAQPVISCHAKAELYKGIYPQSDLTTVQIHAAATNMVMHTELRPIVTQSNGVYWIRFIKIDGEVKPVTVIEENYGARNDVYMKDDDGVYRPQH